MSLTVCVQPESQNTSTFMAFTVPVLLRVLDTFNRPETAKPLKTAMTVTTRNAIILSFLTNFIPLHPIYQSIIAEI